MARESVPKWNVIMAGKGIPLIQRFFKNVGKRSNDECWEWRGGRDQNGYGIIGKGKRHSGRWQAHRLSWTLYNGPIPMGLVLDHICCNPPCVNPAHLRVCTQYENIMYSKCITALNAGKSECIHGHSFADAYIITNRTTGQQSRKCRVCTKLAKKRPRPVTLDQAREIRKLWATGKYYKTELGRMFGICRVTVLRIVRDSINYLREPKPS